MSKTQVDHRRTHFGQYIGHHNNVFYENIIHDIYSWYDNGPGPGQPRGPTTANQIGRDVIQAYGQVAQNKSPTLGLLSERLDHFLELAGRRLADQIQSHFHWKISELLQRLRRCNNSWYQGAGQFKVVLESYFTDKFFAITEQYLLQVLYSLDDTSALAPIKKHFGDTRNDAVAHISNHSGELMYYLFSSDNLSYTAEFVAEHIETPEEYKDDIDSGVTRIKYILTGTLVTNGHELRILAYSLTTPTLRHILSRILLKLQDVRTLLATEDQINQQILPIVCNRLPTQTKTLTALCNSVDAHIPLIHEAQTELRTFYTSKIFMI
ncbi:hypothetical protein B0O80DRAFT_492467 [Mortierella sp. GBAus27b]|nr:hypothetical protein B0O80DRAFT_492467 [Mortierella sp. GBAus27b]